MGKLRRSTIERWYYRALKSADPVGALDRKVRTDAGETQAMSVELLATLGEQYRTFRIGATSCTPKPGGAGREKPELGEAPSYSTVRRRMKARGDQEAAAEDTGKFFGKTSRTTRSSQL